MEVLQHHQTTAGSEPLQVSTKIRTPSIFQEAIGEAPSEPDPDEGKNPAAVALGRLGGKKGGKARAAKMTPEERIITRGGYSEPAHRAHRERLAYSEVLKDQLATALGVLSRSEHDS